MAAVTCGPAGRVLGGAGWSHPRARCPEAVTCFVSFWILCLNAQIPRDRILQASILSVDLGEAHCPKGAALDVFRGRIIRVLEDSLNAGADVVTPLPLWAGQRGWS
jgi:hypothetical protein